MDQTEKFTTTEAKLLQARNLENLSLMSGYALELSEIRLASLPARIEEVIDDDTQIAAAITRTEEDLIDSYNHCEQFYECDNKPDIHDLSSARKLRAATLLGRFATYQIALINEGIASEETVGKTEKQLRQLAFNEFNSPLEQGIITAKLKLAHPISYFSYWAHYYRYFRYTSGEDLPKNLQGISFRDIIKMRKHGTSTLVEALSFQRARNGILERP